MGTDLSVVNAARVSFDKESDWYRSGVGEFCCMGDCLECVKLPKSDKNLIGYLAKHNHFSPFCHAFASFRIKAPVFVARQLVKHQVGLSWNEVSRRYVDSEPEFFIPEVWRGRAENVKQGSGGEIKTPVDISKETRYITQQALDWYMDMLEYGVCPEQARMVLPLNTMTEWVWTGSLYAFARVCNLRLDPHAQKECRDVAKMIGNSMEKLFPVSWQALVKTQEMTEKSSSNDK